jgi:regulator of protease activity HflC (stomatin/prohibitin superfamily)
VQQYQKAVTLTFGKLTSVKEPGFRLYFPLIQTMYKVDLRTRVHELLPQHIITRDNVSCSVTAVIYYHVEDAEMAVLRVTDVDNGIHQLAQTELRDLLCQKPFNDILENRDEYSQIITAKVERRCADWGVKVEHVQLKNIDLTNDNMVRAMAKEAEATREKMAAMIRADGEYKAAVKLTEAASILAASDIGMELRRLQTLERIAKEKNQTTLVVPMQIFQKLNGARSGAADGSAEKHHTTSAGFTELTKDEWAKLSREIENEISRSSPVATPATGASVEAELEESDSETGADVGKKAGPPSSDK